jgi:hypothetical protein
MSRAAVEPAKPSRGLVGAADFQFADAQRTCATRVLADVWFWNDADIRRCPLYSRYRAQSDLGESGRCADWVKAKNRDAPPATAPSSGV